jgi:hypothetical protein
MFQDKPEWVEYQRRRFTRPDADRYIRHDACRFMPPGASRDVVRYFQPDQKHARLAQSFDHEDELALDAEVRELRWLRSELAAIKEALTFRRLLLVKANFNPSQPRVPAGNPDGGQWTNEGAEPRAASQLAFLAPTVPAVGKALEAALSLYALWSSRNGPDNRAVLAFRADAFRPGATSKGPAVRVGNLTEDQVNEACPRYTEVQSITNQAAASTDRGAYETAGAYGTAVHKKIEEEINGPTTYPRSPPRDPNFRAEASLIKSRDAGRG